MPKSSVGCGFGDDSLAFQPAGLGHIAQVGPCHSSSDRELVSRSELLGKAKCGCQCPEPAREGPYARSVEPRAGPIDWTPGEPRYVGKSQRPGRLSDCLPALNRATSISRSEEHTSEL